MHRQAVGDRVPGTGGNIRSSLSVGNMVNQYVDWCILVLAMRSGLLQSFSTSQVYLAQEQNCQSFSSQFF